MKASKFNLKAIMTNAWTLYKNGGRRFSQALKEAWAAAKNPMAKIQDDKMFLINQINYGVRNASVWALVEEIMYKVIEKGGFAADVASTVMKYNKISEKQAFVIARAYNA